MHQTHNRRDMSGYTNMLTISLYHFVEGVNSLVVNFCERGVEIWRFQTMQND